MCGSHKVFLLASLFIFFLFLAPVTSRGQSSTGDPFEEILSELRLVREHLDRLETNQKELLARQGKILEELDRIRIWVHRR